MAKKIEGYIKLQVPAGDAKPAPPIGPALGQRGVNIMEFCKAFNAATQDLETAMPIPTIITVYADRSFTFVTKTPPATFLIKKAANLKSGSKEPGKVSAGTIARSKLAEIAQAKMADLNGVRGMFLQLARPIDFQAVDGLPVDLLFVLLSPLDAGADHLKALAGVSRMLRNDSIAERLRGAKNDEALYAMLVDAEARDAA